MAIQIPDAGQGDGKTGDNEYVLWQKTINNFSDQNNAASKLVGTAAGNVMQVGAFGVGENGGGYPNFSRFTLLSEDDAAGTPEFQVTISAGWDSGLRLFQILMGLNSNNIGYRKRGGDGKWGTYFKIYHTGNTTKDANGFLKAASPIVKVFADKVELNDDAVNQNVTYKKNGIGDYTITTVSGLSTDGWYIELPKDMNGNPKVAVTLSEVDGVISLKTYKRIFSMETFTFEPDLDNPLDIPDTRWIDLRLNEIPVEMPDDIEDDIQTEDTALDKE